MLEIRIICDPPEETGVLDALRMVFELDPVRRYPTRGQTRIRLYTTAAPIRETETATVRRIHPGPDPQAAYTEAPSLIIELDWVADQAAARASGAHMGREFWLRKAALLDRIALHGTENYIPEVAARTVENADRAAAWLADFDHTHGTTRGPLMALVAPESLSYRPYVRQEYLAWNTQRTES
ncbi:hypothetical protein LHJ74_04510 [Streptomyces sp. N2-109]|uniref:CYTH domain-containing protein n=1 Tax=Streptomyces gossypii TaxID=2883101 RepID=A0ABT2JMZ6_9ACTN|nr:hypothetical protein [Streptomyces gossypii]MCT2589201.1 hypothetical protein [Streptomyces gossypii]